MSKEFPANVKSRSDTFDAINGYRETLERKGRRTDIVEEALVKAETLRRDYHTIFYLAGGLTGMSDEVKARYGYLSELVAENEGMFGYAPHLHGTDPVAHPNVSSEEVRDIDFLFSAIIPDYHLNCWYPMAHGNAVEAGWAELADVPSVYLVPKKITLSRLVRGMHNIATTIVYDEFEKDGLSQVRQWISEERRQ